MAGDLLRETERAAIISLRADAPLLAIVAKASIDPVGEAPAWPFVRLDGSQALPQGRGCTARSEVSFMLHSFAKARTNGAGAKIETAKDHAARAGNAVVEAIHNHAFTVAGRRYQFTVRSTRLMPDGGEKDGYHHLANVVARAYAG